MTTASIKRGLLFGALSAFGTWFCFLRGSGKKEDDGVHHPAPAFAGKGGHKDAPTHVRDAGPDHMRDAPHIWDATDEASDESFPASDPPSTY